MQQGENEDDDRAEQAGDGGGDGVGSDVGNLVIRRIIAGTGDFTSCGEAEFFGDVVETVGQLRGEGETNKARARETSSP